VRERVYPVGRLDFHSSGLMLLTNDGELANHLMSRATAAPRTYHVKLDGAPSPGDIRRLEQGIALDGQRTAPARIRPLSRAAAGPRGGGRAAGAGRGEAAGERSRRAAGVQGYAASKPKIGDSESDKTWYEITLVEGRYHQVRRLFERIGQRVIKLKRVRMAFLGVQGLAPGGFRSLTPAEVERLRKL